MPWPIAPCAQPTPNVGTFCGATLATRIMRARPTNNTPTIGFPWPSVLRLLVTRRPTAVRRLVVAVVVDTFKSQTVGSFAHVSEEVGESAFALPCSTDSDAAATVMFPVLMSSVQASVEHVLPRAVGRRTTRPILTRMAMGYCSVSFTEANMLAFDPTHLAASRRCQRRRLATAALTYPAGVWKRHLGARRTPRMASDEPIRLAFDNSARLLGRGRDRCGQPATALAQGHAHGRHFIRDCQLSKVRAGGGC